MQHALETQILSLGFDVFGICEAELPEAAPLGLMEFLAHGYHGEMEWMQARAEMRGDIKKLWPEAKTAIVVGHNYAPASNPLEKLKDKHLGNISVYASNLDYHDVMKKKLKELARWLVAEYGVEAKVFVDTAPVMEKPLAVAAGLGFQGKHTCLISREYGNWLFLGVVLLSCGADFAQAKDVSTGSHGANEAIADPAQPLRGSQDLCGTCTRCIDICPTQAIIAPYKLDARKCISYLTIEHKGHIPVEYRKAIGNRIYGCDDCLAICPWNKFAQASNEAAYHPRESLVAPKLADLVVLDDAAFRAMFAKSPIKRIGRNRFVRNVCIAIGNSEDANYLPLLEPLLNDENELVSEAAGWAHERLAEGG